MIDRIDPGSRPGRMGDRPASMLHRRPSKPDKWREGQANRLADERSGRDKEHGHTVERTLFQIDMSLSEDLAEMMISADVRKDQVSSRTVGLNFHSCGWVPRRNRMVADENSTPLF